MAYAALGGCAKGGHEDPVHVGDCRRTEEEQPIDAIERAEGRRIREVEWDALDQIAEGAAGNLDIPRGDPNRRAEPKQFVDQRRADVAGRPGDRMGEVMKRCPWW